jgi:hypothetical protein
MQSSGAKSAGSIQATQRVPGDVAQSHRAGFVAIREKVLTPFSSVVRFII